MRLEPEGRVHGSQRRSCETALAPFLQSFLGAGPHLPWPEEYHLPKSLPPLQPPACLPIAQLGGRGEEEPRPLLSEAEKEMSGRAALGCWVFLPPLLRWAHSSSLSFLPGALLQGC